MLFWGFGLEFIKVSFFILFSSLKNDNLGFSFTGSALSSSSKNAIFCLGLGLFSFSFLESFPKLSNKFNLAFGCSCPIFILRLAFTILLLFSIFTGSLSFFSSKNENLGFVSFCLGSSLNKLKLDSLISFREEFCWANRFTFWVISAVLSIIFLDSISSSSSLSNIFFNLFLAFSKSLFFFISIAFVSFWKKLKLGCIIDCCGIGIWLCGCWFICSCGICTCNWGGFIIWIWPIGICICDWFCIIFCCWICSCGWGLGIPIIIIGWTLLLFPCWFCSKFGLICGFSSIIWFIWGFFTGNWVGFLLKILALKSS